MSKPIYDIFLSHNRADKPWTERLATRIEADRDGPQLRVFFDKWIMGPGSDIPLELEQGLQDSKYIGLVLSPKALASDWVALERSTAIYTDPRARKKRLIPLLRKDCEVPHMLARINAIDFRLEQNFEESLAVLINFLRGRSPRRDSHVNPEDVQFREDAELLRAHRSIFERPAFQVPCIWELFIRELVDAIDDTMAAINTGKLYSRNGRQLANLSGRGEYRLPEFRDAFSRIANSLTKLKREVLDFEAIFKNAQPEYSHHQNFYAMLMSTRWAKMKVAFIRRLVGHMDSIDRLRNDIIDELNVLSVRCGEPAPFKNIEISSEILKRGSIGGSDSIAPLLR